MRSHLTIQGLCEALGLRVDAAVIVLVAHGFRAPARIIRYVAVGPTHSVSCIPEYEMVGVDAVEASAFRLRAGCSAT